MVGALREKVMFKQRRGGSWPGYMGASISGRGRSQSKGLKISASLACTRVSKDASVGDKQEVKSKK